MKMATIGKKNISIPASLRFLFPYKEKPLVFVPNNKALYLLTQNKLSIIFINWLFQGMLGCSRLDLLGKMLFILIFSSTFVYLQNGKDFAGLVKVFLAAHTLNWLLNTHFWDLGRFIGFTRTNPQRFYPFLYGTEKRIKKNKSLLGAVVLGGASRGEGVKRTSDIDMYFISKPGFLNQAISIFIAIRERVLAFLIKFPLNLVLSDKIEILLKCRRDEIPFIVLDAEQQIEAFYKALNRNVAPSQDYAKISR